MEFKVSFFKKEWEAKERKMLFNDILSFCEDEANLENQVNNFSENEKTIVEGL